jgi:hypothetical protein
MQAVAGRSHVFVSLSPWLDRSSSRRMASPRLTLRGICGYRAGVTTDRCAVSSAKLVQAVTQGQMLTCSELSPAQLDRSNDDQHVIPAEVIRDILRGQCADNPDPRGVQVTAARIGGKLNLDGVDCKVGLTLRGCWFDQPITAQGAKLPWLWLCDSDLPALIADRL